MPKVNSYGAFKQTGNELAERVRQSALRVNHGQWTTSARSAHRVKDASRFERLTFRMPPALPGDGYRISIFP